MTEITLGSAKVRWSDASFGPLGHRPAGAHDESCCGDEAVRRRQTFFDKQWLRLVQVHGATVVVAQDVHTAADVEADAAVTARADVALGVATADCAPLALVCDEGVVGAVHAGWKGLGAGVVTEAAKSMRELGATHIRAALGPCIHAECYEFDGPQLEQLAQQFGEGVISETSWGGPALDMVAATKAACAAANVDLVYIHDDCTACAEHVTYFSYRARGDVGRQVMVVWRPSEP